MIDLPGYTITSKIYESASSVVYRARRNGGPREGQEERERPVILKVLKADHPTPEELNRYRREYEMTHCHELDGVVHALGMERIENTLALVMEDFGGESLQKVTAGKRLTLAEALNVGGRAADILRRTHAAGIIHKDVNPSNLIWNPDTEQLKLIDFGIATRFSREDPVFETPNAIEGTLAYISPEQTGRMNHVLDYRSDFYSLGATLFELITGRPPFNSRDPLEMLHCHIALEPEPPHRIDPRVPKMVSMLVLRLLAKNPAERYQSASGIAADLKLCLEQVRSNGRVEPFSPGMQDFSERFEIPQKLYGREREVQTLHSVFERIVSGSAPAAGNELLLVSGYSGVGKTSLVREIYEPLTRMRGAFISGKFDQLRHGIPYGAVLGAFRRLIHTLLAEGEAEFHRRRQDLLDTLGMNAGVLIQVLPELELITGPQPVPSAVDSVDAQNRFHLTFHKFVSVFARPEHPLVVFLDDLQWADGPSLRLLEYLLTGTPIQSLLIIGAYRENETGPDHPLSLMLETVRDARAAVTSIVLSPLELRDVHVLVTETLSRPLDETLPLSELVYAKTGGNPLIISEFLESIHRNGLLAFDHERRRWKWDYEGIEELNPPGGIAELLPGRMHGLTAEAREVLKAAACIGNSFDLKTLVVLSKQPEPEVSACLREFIAAGLVFPVGKERRMADRVLDMDGLCDCALAASSNYRFAHDRVQQAAYSLIPGDERKAAHLEAGRLLLRFFGPSEREDRLFEIATHLNLGTELIESSPERLELTRLNLMAGRKARAATAFESALQYFKAGISLLGDRCWEDEYRLSLDLYTGGAEAAGACSDYLEMEWLVETVLHRAATLLDKIDAYEVKILAYSVLQNKLTETLDFALPVLKELGFSLPREPRKSRIFWEWLKLKLALGKVGIEDLADLPEMVDPRELAIVRIADKIGPSAYITSPALFAFLVIKKTSFFVKHGVCGSFASDCLCYAMILLGVNEDHEEAFRFARAGKRLMDRFGDPASWIYCECVFNLLIRHWKTHAVDTLAPLLQVYHKGLECGNLEYAFYGAGNRLIHMYLIGWELEGLSREWFLYEGVMTRSKHVWAVHTVALYRQVLMNLMGQSADPVSIAGPACNEEDIVPVLEGMKDTYVLFDIHLNKLILNYLFERYPQAVESSLKAREIIDSQLCRLSYGFYFFYDSLALLAVFPESTKAERRAIRKRVAANRKRLKKWSDWAPANYSHKFCLVEAELARVRGRHDDAERLFDRAIELAGKEGYIREQAIANERAAVFYLDRDRKTVAKAYIKEARYLYKRWGAAAKVESLDRSYDRLFAGRGPRLPDSETAPSKGSEFPTASATSTTDKHEMDLASILKATRAISGEIALPKLLGSLIRIAVENAGAQRGLLTIRSADGLFVEAEGRVGSEDAVVLQSIPVENGRDFPASVIRYAARTGESVILNDARGDSRFAGDPYLAEASSGSILCLPLVRQGSIVGVLYMENNLTTDAFTEGGCIKTLELLCAQAAISIENAKLYERMEEYSHTLEEKVSERTASLEIAMMELERLACLDGLTQIANRRRFDEYLEQEWARSRREGSSISLIICDVDFFKLFNDTYGHKAGDECLCSVAAAINTSTRRPGDLAARYGGEEFAVILPDTDAEGALHVAESLRSKIHALAIPHRASSVAGHVTLSMGIASMIPKRSAAPGTLIVLADEALYGAKALGRDRIIVSPHPDR